MKDNTWPCRKKDVTKEDVDTFIEKAYTLLTKMFTDDFGTDADGDIPVDFHFVNRIVYEPMRFFNVPYGHLLETIKERLERLESICANLFMIQDQLGKELRALLYDKRLVNRILEESKNGQNNG